MQPSFGRVDLETSELYAVLVGCDDDGPFKFFTFSSQCCRTSSLVHLFSLRLFSTSFSKQTQPISSFSFELCAAAPIHPRTGFVLLLRLLEKERPHMMGLSRFFFLYLSFIFLLFMLIYFIRYQSLAIIDCLMGHPKASSTK